MIIFNPHSTKHLALLLFGGEIKDREQVQIGEYKTGQNKGQPKYQWKEVVYKIQGLGLVATKDMLTDKCNISLNDKILSKIAKGYKTTKDNLIEERGSDELNPYVLAWNKDRDKSININTTPDAKNNKKIARQVAGLVLELRGLQKEISTYYEGFETLLHDFDSCIHGNLNHVSTDTGRLSSNKPNLQNLTRS
jgi:hypothetical protein